LFSLALIVPAIGLVAPASAAEQTFTNPDGATVTYDDEVAVGETIRVSGTKWLAKPDMVEEGEEGSVIGFKLIDDSNGNGQLQRTFSLDNPRLGTPVTNDTVWGTVWADSEGNFEIELDWPDASNAVTDPAWEAGDTFTLQLLSGTMYSDQPGVDPSQRPDVSRTIPLTITVADGGGSGEPEPEPEALEVAQHPEPAEVANGAEASFTAASKGGVDPVTVQWQRSTGASATNPPANFTNLTAANTVDESFAKPTLKVVTGQNTNVNNRWYRAVFTDADGATVTSDPAKLSIAPKPTVSTHPAGQTIREGETASFSAAGTGQDSVQWQSTKTVLGNGEPDDSTWAPVAGATNTTLEISGTDADAQHGTFYRAVFTNASGSTESYPAQLRFFEKLDTNGSVAVNGESYGPSGTEPSPFSVTAPNAVVKGEPIVIEGTGYVHPDGAQGSVANFMVDASYSGDPNTLNTTREVINPVTGQPFADKRSHAIVQANADGTWRAEIPWPDETNTTRDAAFFEQNWGEGSQHMVRILTGTLLPGDYQRGISVRFTVVDEPTEEPGEAPQVTTQPENATVEAGENASFTAAASGDPAPTVQWQSKSGDGDWTPIAGATDPTLNLTAVTADQDGTQYRAVFMNDAGSATSDPATLTVTPKQDPDLLYTQVTSNGEPAGVLITPKKVKVGEPITISGTGWFKADGTGGSAGPIFFNQGGGCAGTGPVSVDGREIENQVPDSTYNDARAHGVWMSDENGDWTITVPFPTPENSSLTEETAWKAGDSQCIRILTGSLAPGDLIRNPTANFDIVAGDEDPTEEAPEVTTQPENVEVEAGEDASFTAAASGTPAPTVQWQSKSGDGDWTAIEGATDPTLNLAAVTADQDGTQYRAVFTNDAGSATSDAATLTVNAGEEPGEAPQVTTQPENATVEAGENASFTAAASGDPAPTVQWQSKSGDGDWTPIAGATDPTLNLAAVTADQDGTQYRAVFTNDAGSATSDPATLTVTEKPDPAEGAIAVTDTTVEQYDNVWFNLSDFEPGSEVTVELADGEDGDAIASKAYTIGDDGNTANPDGQTYRKVTVPRDAAPGADYVLRVVDANGEVVAVSENITVTEATTRVFNPGDHAGGEEDLLVQRGGTWTFHAVGFGPDGKLTASAEVDGETVTLDGIGQISAGEKAWQLDENGDTTRDDYTRVRLPSSVPPGPLDVTFTDGDKTVTKTLEVEPPEEAAVAVAESGELGGTLRVTGEGFVHPTDGGSTVAIKIDDGAYSRVDTSTHQNKTIWWVVEADEHGSFSIDMPLPNGTTEDDGDSLGSVPVLEPGQTHTLRFLTGSLKPGDQSRTLESTPFTVTDAGGEDPGTDPGADPGEDPGSDPGAEPGTDPGTDPGEDPGAEPGTDPGAEPGTDPGEDPGAEPGTDPGAEPGTDPGEDPGADPGTDPGAEPGEDPGSDPGAEPGSDPGAEPGTDPGEDPGSDPGEEPDSEPEVTTQPKDAEVKEGEDATFTAAAAGAPKPTVKWQFSTDDGKTWEPFESDAEATALAEDEESTLTVRSVTAEQNGHQFRAVFSNSVGETTSSAATLTVTKADDPGDGGDDGASDGGDGGASDGAGDGDGGPAGGKLPATGSPLGAGLLGIAGLLMLAGVVLTGKALRRRIGVS